MKSMPWIEDFVNETCLFFLQQDSRLYYPFILSSLLLAIVYFIFLKVYQQKNNLKLIPFLFPKKIIQSPSFKLDIQLFIVNNLLRSFVVVPLAFIAIKCMWTTVQCLDSLFGYYMVENWSSTSISVLYTIIFFILSDLSRWVLHYFFHNSSLLWSFHKVHHSATYLTPLTVFRLHPFEFFMYKLRGIMIFSLVGGAFYYLFRTQITPFTILSIHAGLFIFNIVGSNLRHSHIHIAYPNWLEKIFISPAQHQLHHCALEPKKYVNYGSTLAIWDWIAGTLQYGRTFITLRYGAQNPSSNKLVRSIFDPFRKLFKR